VEDTAWRKEPEGHWRPRVDRYLSSAGWHEPYMSSAYWVTMNDFLNANAWELNRINLPGPVIRDKNPVGGAVGGAWPDLERLTRLFFFQRRGPAVPAAVVFYSSEPSSLLKQGLELRTLGRGF